MADDLSAEKLRRECAPSPPHEAVGDLLLAALGSMPQVSLLVLDRDLRYRAVVGGAVVRHGYDPVGMIGRRAQDVLGPERWARVQPHMTSALCGLREAEVFETSDGTIYQAHYDPVRQGAQITGVVIRVLDITAEHAARHDLQQARNHLEQLGANARDILSLVDADGRFTWVSASVIDMLGWTPSHLVGTPVLELIHPDDHERIGANFDRLVAGEANVHATYRYRCADGSWLWVEGRAGIIKGPDGSFCGYAGTVRDITATRALTQHLTETVETFELSFKSAPIGKALVAPDGSFLKVNPALCALSGRSESELLGLTFADITHPDDLAADLELLRQVAHGERESYQMEKRYLRRDGSAVLVQLSVAVARHPDGTVRFYIAQIQDITQRKADEERLLHLATHDALTGLWNRLRLREELERAAVAAQRLDLTPSLLLIDLDGFKSLNDELGHAAGDDHLCAVAQILTGCTRTLDGAARLGGDEFAVLLLNGLVSRPERVAERILSGVRNLECRTATSIGIATIRSGESVDSWLGRADAAMYAAKRAGGNRYLRSGYSGSHVAPDGAGEPTR